MRVLSILMISFAQLAHAGGMVTSGGDLLRNARNPWWVKNTASVNYCIEIDKKTISATEDAINDLVARALEYWKTEFARKLKLVKNKDVLNQYLNQIGVGIQDFKKINCNGSEDLRFKFGYGTLTPEQVAYMADIRSHVSAAVRTDYDDIHLKGKGFVYIASDIGPHSYAGGADLIQKPWQYDFFLYLAIVHELGHVFGLPHIGETYTLMSEGFLEYILNEAVAESVKSIPVRGVTLIPFFFFPASYFVTCSKSGFPASAVNYFNIPAGTTCMHFVIDADNKQLLMYASPGTAFYPSTYLGGIRDLELDADFTIGITLFLTDAQTVFPKPPTPFHFMMGPMFVDKNGPANFYPLLGLARPLFVDLNSRSFALVGTAGTKLEAMLKGRTEIIPHY
jgi:hypothetical protein